MTKDLHISTDRITFDEDLLERLSAATSLPDRNGCMFYDAGEGRYIDVVVDGFKRTVVSVLRVAFYFAGRGSVGHEHEVAHVCANKGPSSGTRLCIAPDHLERGDKHTAKRRLHHAGHVARMRKVLPNYGRSAAA